MNIAKLKRRKRLSVLFLAFIAITISGFLILSASRDSLIYFYSPTELMEIKNIDNKTIRIGGLVKEESIISKDKSKIEFIVEDGKNYLYVHYEGILPDLFREGQGAVIEGYFKNNKIFNAVTVFAKHDENYMPSSIKSNLEDSGYWNKKY